MCRKLILFTSSYPYGQAEAFLESELPVVASYFDLITIQPMTMGRCDVSRTVPENVTVNQPIVSGNRFKKLFFAACRLFRYDGLRSEFFKRKVYCSRIRLYNYLLAVTIMSSWQKRCIDVDEAILYFYWGFGAAYLIPALRAESYKVVVRLHAGDLYEECSDGYLPLRSGIFECADRICPVSDYGKRYLINKYPQVAQKISTSRLGTKDFGLGLFCPKGQRKVIVSCGNLIPLKRIHLLAEYLGQLTTSVTWHHFGDGPELSLVKSIVKKHPENIETVLHGRKSNSEVLHFYANNHIDAFVSVSSREGVPVSIMEAMSFGLPVLATDVGGTAEILCATRSVLIPKDLDKHVFADAMDKVLSLSLSIDSRIEIRNYWHKVSSAKVNYKIFAENVLLGD